MASVGHALADGAILVVEDDPGARNILKNLLGIRYPRVTLHFAETGEAGLQLFREVAPDLVLTDLHLCRMTGIEMAEEVRRIAPRVPIVVLTADSDTEMLLDSIRLGISRYVLKPIACKALFEAIDDSFSRAVLERQVQAQHAALCASEAKYRSIFENSIVGLLVADASGKVLEANPAACGIFGLTADGLRDRRWPELFDLSDPALAPLAGAQEFHAQVKALRADAMPLPVEIASASHHNADGGSGLSLVVHDLSQRHFAEQAALLAKKDWERTFNASADPIMIIDSEHRIRLANRALADLAGVRLEEVVGRTCCTCLHRLRHPSPDCPHALLMRDGLPHSAEMYEPYLQKYLQVSVTPLFDPMGNLVGSVHFTRDITEQKKAEAALRESEERYHRLFNSLHEGFSLLETSLEKSRAEFRFVEVNAAFEKLVGLRSGEIVGRSIRDAFPELEGEFLNILTQVARTGVPITRELRTLVGERHLETHVYAPASGELAVLYSDVSERRKLQEEREKNERLESLGVLAGGIAHDFNNILTAIAGNISLARFKLDTPAEAKLRLAESENAVAKAAGLTRQLLTFARGGQPVKKLLVTDALIHEAVSLFLSGANCKAELHLAPDLWCIDGDGAQIHQALHNLLLNAVQAMPQGGVITIGAENETVTSTDSRQLAAGRYVKLVIADEGCGIPPEILPKVFDPYFTTKPTGSGLGLASVFSIVKRHNGAISASSQPGMGTTFEILLPAAAGASAVEPLPPSRPSSAPGGGQTVLVMDDEDSIRCVAVRMLSILGYASTPCCDGEEAVRLYREQLTRGKPFAAVVLDMTVPGAMGGREAAQLIREADRDAVIIISSGYFPDVLSDGTGDTLVNGMVAKPYNLEQLAEVLSVALER